MEKKQKSSVLLSFLLLVVCSCSVMSGRYSSHKTFPAPSSKYRYQGILEEVMIPSREPGMVERRAIVYLPPDYYKCENRYPVFYLLHGARGNELSWIDLGGILKVVDSLRGKRQIRDFILVLPNMNSYKDARDYGYSRAKNALSSFYGVNGTVETFFVEDVVGTMDMRYRTENFKKSRAIAGMSIGALQTIYISAMHPSVFGSVGLFSPMVHSFIKPGEYSAFYSHLWDKMDRQFSEPPQDYWIMIGKKDFFYPHMLKWHQHLLERNFDHTIVVSEGGHQWYNWTGFATAFIGSCAAFR